MIRRYPFASVSHQQCIVIMNALKESFTPEDVKTLKDFILVELEGQAHMEFPSGRTTSGMNMGQITQIAFELRNLTQALLNDEDSDVEEETKELVEKRQEMELWQLFCKHKIDKIEKVWNRKLEDTSASDEQGKSSEKAEDDDSQDDNINALLARFDKNRLSRSHVEHRKPDQTAQDLQAATESLKPTAKDTNDVESNINELGAKEEYAANNFWRAPEAYSLDDLLNEVEWLPLKWPLLIVP